MKKPIYIIFFCLFIISNSYGQIESDSLKYELQTILTNSERARIYNKLADRYLDINLVESRMYADSAITIGRDLNDYEVISDGWVNYANSYFYAGNLDSALICYEKSYSVILKSHNLIEIASSLNRLGLIYEAKSDFVQATEYYFESLRLYEMVNYKKGIADLFNNLGVIHDNFGINDKALEYYYLSLDNYIELDNSRGQANIYNNISTYYSDNNQPDTALYYLMIAKDIFIDINMLYEAATSIYNISTLYFEKQMYDSSWYYLDTAMSIYQIQGNQNGIANIYNQRAKLNIIENDKEEAMNNLLTCYEIREFVGDLQATSQTLLELSNIYNDLDNSEKAYRYYVEYTNLKDSIYDENVSSKISELNIKYETQKKEKEIVLLKKEAEIKKNTNKFLLIGLIALLLIIALLVTFVRNRIKLAKSDRKYFEQQKIVNQLKIDKQKAEKKILEQEVLQQLETNKLQEQKYLGELEHRNRELVTLTMHLLNKNKALIEVGELFKDLTSKDVAQKRTFKDLLKKINDNLNLDSDWDQFKLHFENVNTGFFDELQKRHPSLSAGDLKVCAYIKINLSNKEIAQMMNISVAGINKRLYRIRKKIDIDSSINISKYLTEL